MSDLGLAKKLRDAVHGALDIAFDALQVKGYEVADLMIVNGPELFQHRLLIKRGVRRLSTGQAVSWDEAVFEVMLTFELDATPPHVNVFERWLLEPARIPVRA